MTVLAAYEPNATDRAPIRFAAAAARFAAAPLVVASVHAPPSTRTDADAGELAPPSAELRRGLQQIATEEHADLVVGTFANARRRRDQGTGSFFGDADH
jgi:hypothetical protein